MSITVRPRLTSGIATLSASAIIATTVSAMPQHVTAPAFPQLPGVTTSVQLAALVNPLSAIDQTLQTTVTDVRQFITGLTSNPLIAALVGPQTVSTLKQLVTIGQSALTDLGTSLNQDLSSAVQTVLQSVEAGNWQSALDSVLSTANTIKTVPPVILQAVLIGSVSQLLQSVAPGVTALQTALKSGNLGNIVNAVVGITKTVITSVVGKTGLISQLLTIAQALSQTSTSHAAATAAVKPTPTAAAALPSNSAKSLTLSTTATAAAATAAAPPAKSTAITASKATKDRGKKQAAASTPASGNPSSATAASSSSAGNSTPATDTSTKSDKADKGSHSTGNHKGNSGGRGDK
ncbi:hypothetical protein ABIA30_002684 [Mycobacterium sp. MAA66]|uniref:hypothetical protein n=1 Tax=Mycobacterium sp. MAA66 TaxID=3156297 RepID=UPI0035152B93